jgi:putative membrane protein
MPGLTLILMTVAALIHVGIFAMESVLWHRPAVHRLFGVRDRDEADVMAFALFNQGFYNLFLALGAFTGVALSSDIVTRSHNELLVFTALFMIGAALVLVAGDRQLWRGALLQGGPPLLALVFAVIW